jgi:hypothetical protein
VTHKFHITYRSIAIANTKIVRKVSSSVVDAYSLNPDPDPAFQMNPDQDSIRIQGFYEQKLKKKKMQLKFFLSLFDQKLQFSYP